jgi:hypothetical protein
MDFLISLLIAKTRYYLGTRQVRLGKGTLLHTMNRNGKVVPVLN